MHGSLRGAYRFSGHDHWAPDRSERGHAAPLAALRWIAAAIRLWRRRTRSRQQLRELNDHLLKDIGLSREAASYEAAKPFWR
jgi:uncharacterized protein YjiS (DUF1127 family)